MRAIMLVVMVALASVASVPAMALGNNQKNLGIAGSMDSAVVDMCERINYKGWYCLDVRAVQISIYHEYWEWMKNHSATVDDYVNAKTECIDLYGENACLAFDDGIDDFLVKFFRHEGRWMAVEEYDHQHTVCEQNFGKACAEFNEYRKYAGSPRPAMSCGTYRSTDGKIYTKAIKSEQCDPPR